ncbi:MAG: twin-arginine translocase subunit TatC [Desulfurivibrionaceae bacterium]|nr:twin-arginine translocase subunit TatC [Desulfurivibrionaceae bacterium]
MSEVLTGHFQGHLQELRRRITISFLAVALASGIAYLFSESITSFLIAPLFASTPELSHLVYTNLTEAFVSYLKISVLVGLFVAFPVVLYQVWMFAAPGLHSHEKRFALMVVFWASCLFAFGVIFSYVGVLPRALIYLMSFAGEDLTALPKLDSYLSFVARWALVFGLSFQIPFLMVMAGKAGFVDRAYFRRQRKYFYLAILILSFLLAAGDFMATTLLVLPLLVLYELGLLVMHIFSPKK